MLKALELFGFKSFADKTRFEFPRGITVIVGPNGSGKSNIVDAIKWALGEQSAKSLRGHDMSDVIFKGSGSGRRKPANTAEATITFDNSDHRLLIDAPEVQVTRRVYRSGEGEYLINGQACRLRDVRDLFRGTGVGTDAYSIIEQGKVDLLLQASARDRRAIFEEAAGISRFKAKKVETQRRLARVQQHLIRLSDIVDEVETRLKSVRAQAAKARRYREYTDRLRELRTETSRADWRRLTDQLDIHQRRLDQLQTESTSTSRLLQQQQNQLNHFESEAQASGERLREGAAHLARVQERLASVRQSQARELQQSRQLEQQAHQLQLQWCKALERHRGLSTHQDDLWQQLHQAQVTCEAQRRELVQRQAQVESMKAEVEQLEAQLVDRRQHLQHQMRSSVDLGNLAGRLESQLAGLAQQLRQSQERKEQLEEQISQATRQLLGLESEERELAEAAARTSAAVEQTRRQLNDLQARIDKLRDQQAELRTQQTAAQERLTVLAELEQRQEGIGVGVKDILSRAADQVGSPLGDVLGMVADLVQVQVDLAPLLDVALGSKAQFIVLRRDRLVEEIQSGRYRPPGRVGLLPIDKALDRPGGESPEWSSDPAIIGRADHFTRTDDRYAGLVTHLLGKTWLVETLADARRLQARAKSRDLQWVTRAGEVVFGDGSVLAGPRQPGIGIVSRRSQIAELRRQIERLQRHLSDVSDELHRHGESLQGLQQHLVGLGKQQDQATANYAQKMLQVQGVRQRRDDWQKSLETLEKELADQNRRRDIAAEQSEQVRAERQSLEEHIVQLEGALQADQQELDQRQQQQQAAVDQATEIQVQRATSQQHVESLERQCEQVTREQEERRLAAEQIGHQLQQITGQGEEAERRALEAGSRWAFLALEHQRLRAEAAELQDRYQHLQQQRAAVGEQVQRLRSQQHDQESRCHECDLVIQRLRSERDNLRQRVLEDYGLDLAEAAQRAVQGPQDERTQVDDEIASLRQKLANIGAVNMEAIGELEGLEERFGGLNSQYQDLVQAKESLERIIERINRDSRRLFSETLDRIRENFQQLFRRVFGGGKADIVLEEGIDILEAGVDIVATPPGKHSLSISLLSGGEKALTAVTLLLAIFQYRPSPFCILDEVDGPLDEANIGRFLDVLREFLQWTRFVIVTHSKKTMTAATTLYGVTMQESGISKRVSVQFDDVTEEGEIRSEALMRADDQAQPEVA